MPDFEVLSVTIRSVTLLVAAASLGVAIAALGIVKEGFTVRTANPVQRAAKHDKRHAETIPAFAFQRQVLDSHGRTLETLIERAAPAPDDFTTMRTGANETYVNPPRTETGQA